MNTNCAHFVSHVSGLDFDETRRKQVQRMKPGANPALLYGDPSIQGKKIAT
jgi:hypothetical protein